MCTQFSAVNVTVKRVKEWCFLAGFVDYIYTVFHKYLFKADRKCGRENGGII
jgi:hypothetical protein